MGFPAVDEVVPADFVDAYAEFSSLMTHSERIVAKLTKMYVSR